MDKMDLEKAEEPDIKLPTSTEKTKDLQKNIGFIDYAKAFDCVDHKKTVKFFKRCEYQTTLPVPWETSM